MRRERRWNLRRVTSSLLAVLLVCSNFFWASSWTVRAEEIPVRDNVVNTATSDTIIIGVEGVNKTSDMKTLLDKVNKVRKEACEAGNVPDPRNTSRMLTSSDYVEIKIGKNCNEAATIRAAEAAIYLAHIIMTSQIYLEV